MMDVDTSAIVAILLDEPDAERYLDALLDAPAAVLSAASYVELCAVMAGRVGPAVLDLIEEFLATVGIAVEPLTAEQARQAGVAYTKYKSLNFGDSFSYALAIHHGVKLLFKGADFYETDVRACF